MTLLALFVRLYKSLHFRIVISQCLLYVYILRSLDLLGLFGCKLCGSLLLEASHACHWGQLGVELDWLCSLGLPWLTLSESGPNRVDVWRLQLVSARCLCLPTGLEFGPVDRDSLQVSIALQLKNLALASLDKIAEISTEDQGSSVDF